jgi:hypothetical protein
MAGSSFASLAHGLAHGTVIVMEDDMVDTLVSAEFVVPTRNCHRPNGTTAWTVPVASVVPTTNELVQLAVSWTAVTETPGTGTPARRTCRFTVGIWTEAVVVCPGSVDRGPSMVSSVDVGGRASEHSPAQTC